MYVMLRPLRVPNLPSPPPRIYYYQVSIASGWSTGVYYDLPNSWLGLELTKFKFSVQPEQVNLSTVRLVLCWWFNCQLSWWMPMSYQEKTWKWGYFINWLVYIINWVVYIKFYESKPCLVSNNFKTEAYNEHHGEWK